ncbi:hypothetical protein C5167_028254 [Papaver somniferum]|nr:hypothetical protein C5167_028254 [Papaver somniferum]
MHSSSLQQSTGHRMMPVDPVVRCTWIVAQDFLASISLAAPPSEVSTSDGLRQRNAVSLKHPYRDMIYEPLKADQVDRFYPKSHYFSCRYHRLYFFGLFYTWMKMANIFACLEASCWN